MQNCYELVKSLYKNDLGEPFEMTPSQVEIFESVFYGIVNTYQPTPGAVKRLHVETFTQYGKSEIVSMAVLTAVSSFPVKVALIAPTTNKAKIIMGYVIKHIFDNSYTVNKFDVGRDESLERIRRERSKNRLTFRIPRENGEPSDIGEVFIVSAEARRRGEDAGNALMGFGAPALIEDESALIPDPIHSKGMRMVGGHRRNFVCKVGNPFKRNHFLKSHNNPNYKKIIVDYSVGLSEGRLARDYVEEMRGELFFDVLYEVKFPDQEAIDEHGWMPLLADSDIRRAFVKGGEVNIFGMRRLGVDVAGGGRNSTVIVLRGINYAKKLFKEQIGNQVDVATQINLFKKKWAIEDPNMAIDKNGVGKGAFDIIASHNSFAVGITGAEKPDDNDLFANKRAEMFWRLRQWILSGGKLEEDSDWMQLTQVKYKSKFVNNRAKMLIISKEELMRNGIESPDVADALALTFASPEIAGQSQEIIQQQIRDIAKRKASPPSFR